jgi:Zn-dependent protease
VCHWQGDPSPIGRAAIAWGGIWAQLVVLAAVELWQQLGGMPRDYVMYRIVHTLTVSNAYMIAFNLLPIPPLDGAEAWRLPILLGRSLRSGPVSKVMPAPVGTAHDEEFEAGHRRDEVRAIVSNLLDEARKE